MTTFLAVTGRQQVISATPGSTVLIWINPRLLACRQMNAPQRLTPGSARSGSCIYF
jgi:hypothetical protein